MNIKKNILFICTGNTCRSPFAENMLRKLLLTRYGENAADIRVSSAGTYAFTGIQPPPDAVKAAESFGVNLAGHRSRSVHLSMIEASDMVFCMTAQHKAHLVAKFPWYEDRIYVLKQYSESAIEKNTPASSDDTERYNIPDPIGQGIDVYREVYRDIKEDLEKVLDMWESEKEFRMKMARTYRIAIASDHAGFRLKADIADYLKGLGHEVKDFGVGAADEPADYPDYARMVALDISREKYDFGVLVCGSGVGMSMTANRIRGVRAVLCNDTITAELSRQHNNSNVLCMGERLTTPTVARHIVKTWLSTSYEGGRHEKRVKKIDTEEC